MEKKQAVEQEENEERAVSRKPAEECFQNKRVCKMKPEN